ncbi:MAG: serine/threonine protein kinase [Chloroflexi bacterium]|nr:serine/threonine protein kinase [Chloroflexota bacterium]
MSLIPIAILFSMARYRLWDVDLVISRALVIGAVTVALIVVFIAAVFAVQQVALRLTGGEQSNLAMAVASLAVAVLFNPVRNKLSEIIDRRFYPRRLKIAREITRRGLDTVAESASALVPRIRDQVTGSQFGQYLLEDLIGRGGMAEVYRGRHGGLDREVAIKVLTPGLAHDERFRVRFQREGRAIATLSHPNIVTIHDSGEHEGMFFIVMEFVHGESLSSIIHRDGPIPIPQVITILRGVAAALDHAHSHGIVHRDVKPHNIMIERKTYPETGELAVRAVLMDFGIARVIESRTALTTGSGALGTLDYIAPEQILESSRVDGRADIYSLGVVAYQMLTGKVPFRGPSPAAVIASHLQVPAPDPRKLNSQIPSRLALTIMRAMAKDPEERPQTAAEFAAGLE